MPSQKSKSSFDPNKELPLLTNSTSSELDSDFELSDQEAAHLT